MFQFAFGKIISINTGQEVLYCTDTLSSFNTIRKFELENAFNLVVPRATRRNISNVLGSWRSAPSIRRILARLNNPYLSGPQFFTENFSYQSALASQKFLQGVYLHGYWQSEDFFISHENVIRRTFQFRGCDSIENKKIMMRIQSGPSIGMHVRRGDYVTNSRTKSIHGVLDTEYYFSAITRIRSSIPDAKLFIFTDDFDWVFKEIVSKVNNSECVNINSGGDSFRDMQLMSNCQHNIIANSTFSWWAAWLNQNPKKMVIAPKNWFSSTPFSVKSIVPDAWEQI